MQKDYGKILLNIPNFCCRPGSGFYGYSHVLMNYLGEHLAPDWVTFNYRWDASPARHWLPQEKAPGRNLPHDTYLHERKKKLHTWFHKDSAEPLARTLVSH